MDIILLERVENLGELGLALGPLGFGQTTPLG